MENSKNLSENIGEGKQEGVINSKEELRGFIELLSRLADGTRDEIYSLLISKRWSHQEIADELIEAKKGWVVAKFLEIFIGLDHQELADELIEAGNGENVAKYLGSFSGLNHREIAEKLIEAGQGKDLIKFLENFSGLNHQEIANKLIEAGYGWPVANNLEKFSGLDKEIAEKLIEAEYGKGVAKNLGSFSGLDHNEIANKLIEAGYGWTVAMNLGSFSGLDKEIVLKLLNNSDQKVQITAFLKLFVRKFLNNSDQEAQITTAKYFIKKDLRKEKNLKPAEGILVLEILKALEMDFYVLLSECWAGKTTAEDMKKQYFDFEIENIDQERQQEFNNQLHALVMAAEKIIKEKGREKLDELKGKYDVNTEKEKIINEWNNHHREQDDQAGNLLRNIVNEGLRKAYIEWREDEVSEWFCERDKVA